MFMYRVVENLGTTCTTTPTPDVTYPKLVSATPLYGRLPLANGSEDVLDFVIDESQPVQEPAAKEEPSLFTPTGRGADRIEVPATRTTKYDLLYVDTNRDRNLTNDPPLRPMKEPPKMFARAGADPSLVVFDYLEVKPAGGDAATPGTPRTVRVLPWLNAMDAQQSYLVIMTTSVRKGRIQIGEVWYEAMMGSAVSGQANLLVRPEAPADAEASKKTWSMLGLGLQQAEGKFYEFSINSAGDQLTVAPYGGPMGELRIEPGERKVEQFAAAGSLQTSTGSVVWLGEPGNYYSEERVRTSQLPAGDYQLSYFTVACGDLLVRSRRTTSKFNLAARQPLPPRFQWLFAPISLMH